MSLAALGWLISAAGRAPFVVLWHWAPWQSYVPLAAMLPVCLILGLSIGSPNPFSFGGARNDRFDPSAPGLVRLTRHPLLLALALWAASHMVPNGDLAHILVFGAFTGFTLLGRRMIDRRRQREMGTEWYGLSAALRQTPVIGSAMSGLSLVRIGGAILFYGALIAAHPYLFGVSPLP